MSVYTFYGLFCEDPKRIPKPGTAFRLEFPELPFDPAAYQYGDIEVDLSQYFSTDMMGFTGAPSIPTDPYVDEFGQAIPHDPAPKKCDYETLAEYYNAYLSWMMKEIRSEVCNNPSPAANTVAHPGSCPSVAQFTDDEGNFNSEGYEAAWQSYLNKYRTWYTAELNEQFLMGEAYLDACGQMGDWFNEEVVTTLILNNSFRRKNKQEKTEYNDAVWNAQQNKIESEKAQARAEQRSRAESKGIEKKSIQKSAQERQSLEKRIIAKMASRFAAQRRAENKRAQKSNKG